MLYTFNTMNHILDAQTMLFSKKSFYLFLFFIVFVFSATVQTSHAFGESSIEITPKYPMPGDTVTAELHAYSIDMDTAQVTWRVNGEIVENDFSVDEISFTADQVGATYVITVSAKDASGTQEDFEKRFTVSDVSFVWQGKTYTPPFYNGLPLLSEGASVAVQAIAAIPNGSNGLYGPHELHYTWFINKSSTPTARGKGQHSIVISNSDRPRQPLTAYVKIKDPTGKVRTEGEVVIPVTNTKTLLYEDNPYIGVRYDAALGSSLGVYGREASVIAEPYYMSAKSRRDEVLEYAWSIAGEVYDSPGSLSFGAEDNISGTTHLELTVENTNHWLQTSNTNLRVNYGKRSSREMVNPETDAL